MNDNTLAIGREWRFDMAFVLQGEYRPPLSIVGMRTKRESNIIVPGRTTGAVMRIPRNDRLP